MSETKRWTAWIAKRLPAGHPVNDIRPDRWRNARGQRVTIDRAEKAIQYLWRCGAQRVYRVSPGTRDRISPGAGCYLCECLLTRADRERLARVVPISPNGDSDWRLGSELRAEA